MLTPVAAIAASAAPTDVSRLAGSNRFATSAAISAASFYPGVPVAYIASGVNFPDALAGAPVAGANGGPVLLSKPTTLSDPVKAELRRLKPQKIVVLGGPAVISDAVQQDLVQYTAGRVAADVTRLAGANRFATSAAISAASFKPGVAVAYVVSGRNFPDALSGAPVAGVKGGPVLLSDHGALSDPIKAELSRLKPRKIVVFGGTAVISEAVKKSLEQYTAGRAAADVSRIAGASRFATSAAISQESFASGVPVAYVASGRNFPDALSGAAVAGARRGPVLMTASSALSDAVRTELERLKPQKIVVLGGTQVVSETTLDALAPYAKGTVAQSVDGDGTVSHGRTTVTTGDGQTNLTVLAPDLDVAAEALREIVASDALVGVPIEVTAGQTAPGETFVLERRYAAPLPEGATATWMYFDETLGGWVAVPSTLSADRRTLRAEVDHLSLWDDIVAGSAAAMGAVRDAAVAAGHAVVEAGKAVGNVVGQATQWAGEQFTKGANGLSYGIGAITGGRTGAPECTGDVPDWVDDVIHVEDFNNPVLWCVGRDAQREDLLVVKARANRGYGYGYETAITPAWEYNSTNEHGALSTMLSVAGDLGGTIAQSMETLTFGGKLVGAGEEVSFGFDEAEARASLEIGEPIVTLKLPDATGFLFTILARLVMEQALNQLDGPIAAVIAVAACADAATTADTPLQAAGALLTCIRSQDEAIAKALATTLGRNATDPRALGKSIGAWVGKASVYLSLVGPVQATLDYLVEASGPEQVRILTVYLTIDGGGPDPSQPLPTIVAHSHGNTGYALRADGTVWSWGPNVYGELGTGAAGSSPRTAVKITGLRDIASVAAGQRQGYAVGKNGTVWAWGNNLDGQLGNGTRTHSNVPLKVPGISDVTELTAQGSVVALRGDGTVWSWGDGETLVPTQVRGLSSIIDIDGQLALRRDGTVWTWGFNGDGQLGIGTFQDSPTAVKVNGLTEVTHIESTGWSNYAKRADGTWWAWGDNYYGQLGIGTTTDSPVPVQVGLSVPGYDIVAVYGNAYAYSASGSALAWGDNRFGELNVGASYVGSTPVSRPRSMSLGGVSAIVPTGWTHYGFAIMADGTVSSWGASSTWGDDSPGLLGNRENCYAPYTNGRYRSVKVLGLTDVASMAVSSSDAYAVRDEGTIWGWGSTIGACSPVKIGG